MSGTNSNINRTPASELTSAMTGTTTGDMKPWRIRLELTHHGISEFNRGTLILRMDENKTFINTGPILTDENAKNKYIIECKISQTIGGSNVDGKIFQFQIKGCSIDVDKHKGSIIMLELVEIQVRLSEAVTSKRHMFITPTNEFSRRLVDFNWFQNSKYEAGSPNVNMLFSACSGNDFTACTGQKKLALPKTDNLKQNYTPVGLETFHELLIDCIKRLSNEETVGGVFTDFYFDFDPVTDTTNTMKCFAEEFGGVDSGITLDPKAIDTIDATKSQQASINHVKFKNHVLVKGNKSSGTLPMEECRYTSILEHAMLRPTWDPAIAYIKDHQVKVVTTFTGTSITDWIAREQSVVRYYKCIQDRSATSTTPDQDTSYWQEDFVNITPFDKYGRYDLDDVVYFKVGSTVKFYRAEKSIDTISLKTLRKVSPIDPDTLEPTDSISHWEDLTTGGSPKIASRSTTNFVDFESPNPWTSDIFDWEKNLAGLETGSLPLEQADFVGYAQDWNIARAVHGKEDYTDSFNQITAKVVRKMFVNNPTELNEREIFDGQRVVVGQVPAGDFLPSTNRSKVAEYVKEPNEGSAGWRFSKVPEHGDTVLDMGSGRIFRYDGTAQGYEVIWNIQGTGSTPLVPENKNVPFHLVWDIYKGPDASGMPNQAIEFRYCWKKTVGTKIYGANSRGAWMNQWFPFPRIDSTNGNLGYQYGGNGTTSDTKFCMLSSFNDKTDRSGNVAGWNNGRDSEDMGSISGLEMFVKVGFWNASVADDLDSSGGGNPYTGHLKDLEFNPFSASGPTITRTVTGDNMGNIKMVFWCIDKFDRIWNYRFQVPRNNEFHRLVIPFGHMASGGSRNLYFGKWSRLPIFLGYVITGLDFTLKEREHTGAGFDWRFVKGWGLQTEMGYNMSLGDYNGGTVMYQEAFTQQITHGVLSVKNAIVDGLIVLGNGVMWGVEQLFGGGNPNPPANTTPMVFNHENTVIDWSTIAISNLHFKKELIVSSDDTSVGGARTVIANKSDEFDYINAKLHAKAKRARASFYPQTWNMTTNGDVRMRFGHKFKIKGDRVPNKDTGQDFITMVCKRVVHTIDHEGYTMQVIGQKKFETTGD